MSSQRLIYTVHLSAFAAQPIAGAKWFDGFFKSTIYYVPEEHFIFIAHPTSRIDFVRIEYENLNDVFYILTDELKKIKFHPLGEL